VEDGRIRLMEEIMFKTGSADIDPKSDEYVSLIAWYIREHRGLDFIEVSGNADNRGSDAENLKLTQKRAEAVMAHLIADGINPNRLRAVGYSSYCPIDPANNEEAWHKNRRVEFQILRRDGNDTAVKWGGCPAALDHKLKIVKIPASAPRTKHVAKKGKIKRKGPQLWFPDEVEFTPGSATLHASAAPVLTELKIFMLANKDVNQVRIEGHVDAPANTPEMVALSKARSMAVAGWLANNGVEPGRLLPVGCGANRPIKNAKGQVDHDKTRRTELWVVKEKGAALAGPAIPPDCVGD